jgi:dihydroorotase-like cyclic amidohydrolase
VRSNNVLVDSSESAKAAYIFIREETIQAVVADEPERQEELKQRLKTYPLVYDFKELFITPGCIDLNMTLHAESQPESVELMSLLSLMGGVTTVVNNALELDASKKKDLDLYAT